MSNKRVYLLTEELAETLCFLSEGHRTKLEDNGLVIVDLSDIERIVACWGPTIATAKDLDLRIYERLEAVCKSAGEGEE